MMIITIGKAQDNDYVVDDAHVSRHHARLVHGEDGFWMLEDLGSSNGTYVNGAQIVKKRVTPTDQIRLGDGCIVQFSDLLKSKNDYSEEFKRLKKTYDDYINEKVKIQSFNQFKTRLFQSLPFALPGIVGMIIGSGQGSHSWMMTCLALAVLAPVGGIYMGARQSAKIPRQLQELNNQFKIDYVCPKCGTFLGEIPWESLKNKKQCPIPSCQAKWVDDDL